MRFAFFSLYSRNPYLRLMRFDRPVGTLLLLWPTLWALWVASQGHPNSKVLIVMILGVIVMRAAGCVINDITDRNIDGWVARTKDRPLAMGEISLRQAMILFLILMGCALSLVLLLNHLTICLALVGALLAVVYPFTKRFFSMPQLMLAITFNWGVVMAFSAQCNAIPLIAWYIYFIACLWCLVYDTLYAMVDKEDDLKIGIKSLAIFFGKADKYAIALLQLLFLTALLFLGKILARSYIYYFCLLAVFVLMIYQQYLITDRNPAKCFQAFLNNQWIGLLVFLGLVLS